MAAEHRGSIGAVSAASAGRPRRRCSARWREATGYAVRESRTGQRGQASDPRKVAMSLVRRLCDLTLAETAARFGVGSYGMVAWVAHEVGTAVRTDAALHRRPHHIEQALNQSKT